MRITAIIIILFLSMGFIAAQNAPEDYTKTFFELVGQKKYAEAIEKIPANKRLENDTSYFAKLQSKLEMVGQKAGEYCGYELIEREEVSLSYIVLTYFIKYLNAPQKIQFTFYKPKDSWQVIQVNFNVQNNPGANGSRKPGLRKQ
jgi:hypothetical protein